MGLRAHLPEWMFRRRRRSFADTPMGLPSAQEVADRRACQGNDPLEAATNWMRHVLNRDFEGREITRAIVVLEVGTGRMAQTVFTTHRTDSTPVEVRGLLSEAMRGQEHMIARNVRQSDIQEFVNAALPQLLEAIEGPVSEAVRLKSADFLVRMQADCVKAGAIAVDPVVRDAFMEAAEWAEKRFKEVEQPSWVDEYVDWTRRNAEEDKA